ncbi:MAG: PIN domain-containing protein [Caldilineaceae bacterium]|nr:PIN domain-containing protein [Caldilineaceae bacterium]
MNWAQSLSKARRLFLDTAPVVYFVEANSRYIELVDYVFAQLQSGQLSGAVSPVTLAECLVVPHRTQDANLLTAFRVLLTQSPEIEFIPIDSNSGDLAAQMRAKYNLSLSDALQVATAISGGCDAFLTNDLTLLRIEEITVLLLDNFLEPNK